jgi:hypothetical protein
MLLHRGDVSAHQGVPLLEIGHLVDVVAALDLRKRGTRLDRNTSARGTPSDPRTARPAAAGCGTSRRRRRREVGAPAAVQEQGVPGDQPPVEQEALAARGVARVCSSSISISPTSTVSPCTCVVRSLMGMPVTRDTHSASWVLTCTGTLTVPAARRAP